MEPNWYLYMGIIVEYSVDSMLYFAIAMVIAGIAAGLIAGLLGVGGGIVLVPVLFYIFTVMGLDPDVRMHMAIGTSLSTIVATAYSSSRAHHAKGAIDVDLLRNWGIFLLLGAIIGMVFFSMLKSSSLTLVFAIMTIMVALYMLLGPTRAEESSGQLPTGLLRSLYGLLVGGLSSIMGIGGGTLSVPLLTLYHYPMRRAIGTAAAIGLVIAIPGTIGAFIAGMHTSGRPPFSIGYVNVLAFILLIPITGYTAPIGARIAHSINPRYLRIAFAIFLIFNACNMLYTAFSH